MADCEGCPDKADKAYRVEGNTLCEQCFREWVEIEQDGSLGTLWKCPMCNTYTDQFDCPECHISVVDVVEVYQ